MLNFIVDEMQRKLRASLYTEGAQPLAPFVNGEVIALSVTSVQRIPNVSAGQIWLPQDLSATVVRVGFGKTLQLPVAGTITFTYGANTTAALGFLPTATQIQTALNAIASITAAGGVVVTSPAPGFYFVTFNNFGARTAIAGDATNLAPLSVIDTATLITGGVAQREVQSIRIVQNPGAFATLSDSIPQAAASVEVIETGGSGANHKVRIKIDPLPYAGRFTVNVQANETGFLDWQISADDMRTAIEGLASVGTGNVAVEKEAGASWVLMFMGDLADTDMSPITTSDGSLQSLSGKSGTLDLRTAGIQLLLAQKDTVAATLEIELVRAGGAPYKALQYDGTLQDAIIKPSSTSPPAILYPGFDHIVTIPADATSPGLPGDVAYDDNFEYRYTGDGTTHKWRRKALAIW